VNLYQTSYTYRPNLACHWLITAPSPDQRVGIKFQYFDLHPDFDRLEVCLNPSLHSMRNLLAGKKANKHIIYLSTVIPHAMDGKIVAWHL
jgi:hypothetical protein